MSPDDEKGRAVRLADGAHLGRRGPTRDRALLHGFLGDPSVWTGISTGTALALPGHGGGPARKRWGGNLALIAEQLRKVVDGRVEVVVGYSLGARIALGLLAGGHVDRAVLISGNAGLADTERDARLAADAAWARRFRDEPLADVLDAWEAQPLFATQTRVAADRLAARRRQRLQHDPAQLAQAIVGMSPGDMPDYRPTLADAARTGRVSLVVGADDARYRALAESSGAPVRVIPDCGHDPLLEQPAALAEVLAFLA